MCPFLCGNHGIRDAASVPYANGFPKPPLNVVGMDVCGPRPRPRHTAHRIPASNRQS